MELLLRGGADASVVDANGRTAEEVAAECRQIRATVRHHSIDLYRVFVYGDPDFEKRDYLALRSCCVLAVPCRRCWKTGDNAVPTGAFPIEAILTRGQDGGMINRKNRPRIKGTCCSMDGTRAGSLAKIWTESVAKNCEIGRNKGWMKLWR